jgi:DNA polymerase
MCAFADRAGDVDIWEKADGQIRLEQLITKMRRRLLIPWNCAFERTLIAKVWHVLNLRWRDAMVDALYAGLPASLKGCDAVPFFKSESVATKETLLINKFCKPQRDGSIRNAKSDPEDWEKFKDYCKRDVADTRMKHQWFLEHFILPERTRRIWEIDQQINERGMPIDRPLTERAWIEAQRLQARENERLKTLTGLDNPNSNAQMLGWLTARGYPYPSLGKELVKKALNEEPDGEPEDVDSNDD